MQTISVDHVTTYTYKIPNRSTAYEPNKAQYSSLPNSIAPRSDYRSTDQPNGRPVIDLFLARASE